MEMERFHVKCLRKMVSTINKKHVNGMSPALHLGSAVFNSYFSFEISYSVNLVQIFRRDAKIHELKKHQVFIDHANQIFVTMKNIPSVQTNDNS